MHTFKALGRLDQGDGQLVEGEDQRAVLMVARTARRWLTLPAGGAMRTTSWWRGLAMAAVVSGTLAAQPAQFSFDYPAIAGRLVQQLRLQPGETVLLVAMPGTFEDLVPHLRQAVMKAGGVDLGVVDVLREPVPAGFDVALLQRGAAASRAAYRDMLRGVDAAIMMPGALPAHPVYAAMQDRLREGQGRTVHFHWVENGSAYPLPGQPLPPRHLIDATYQRAVLDTDYPALEAMARRAEVAMRGGIVRVTTPLGTNLQFRVGPRPVNRQDGDASAARTGQGVILIDREVELPAGVVRVAPVSESVEGTIAFGPSQWDGKAVEGLRIRFAAGQAVSVTATSGVAAAEAEMARVPAAGRHFREFALGLNPLLAVPAENPWIPYYGYGGGVVRLSLGDDTELGGTTGGGYVRWNFFTDATVTFDGEVWVRDGRLVAK
ncbi:MAG: aminopeptidase [Acidobacteria bacterium]|nr:aminopeptidase [Acidobacteriota bacterium]